MARREIHSQVRGQRTVDGAGVHLVRVLGRDTIKDFDPFLMLDSFDSTNPEDYIAGFPTHPHRGIETITYLISGKIEHEDSLKNKDTINAGESQWMTAGSGILHQEMPQPADRMLGFQLWLNLPAADKMTHPTYLSITQDMIPLVEVEAACVRVLSGSFAGIEGVKPNHIQATIYDISLQEDGSIEIPTKLDETVFVFLIEGDAVINDQAIPEKTAVLFEVGSDVLVSARPDTELRFIFCSAKPLHESIAWGGPIVMNTDKELDRAFRELREGSFIKHS